MSIQNKESEKKRPTREDEEYVKCSETSIIKVKGGFSPFTKHLIYLGSYISYSLLDDYDIDAHLAVGNSSMGALAKFWTYASVDSCSRYLIFLAIPISLILWGCEIWVIWTSLLKKLELFPYRSICRILGIIMAEVKGQRITNETVRRIFNILNIEEQIAT